MRCLLLLALLCVGACKHTNEPPPPPGGVHVSVPGVRIHVADSPEPVIVDGWTTSRGGAAR